MTIGNKDGFLIQFIPNVTDKFKHITNRLKSKLAYFSLHKLGWIVRARKDHLSTDSNKNDGYKISCKNCDALYIKRHGSVSRRVYYTICV